MKIYTKKGDKGETSLLGGKKLSKADIRVEAYGTIDELSAWIGVLNDHISGKDVNEVLIAIQRILFHIGSRLASNPGKDFKIPKIEISDIENLEKEIDKMEEELPVLKNFILPGGDVVASFCHLARTVCRRAERRVVALYNVEEVDEKILTFLNRLSDYLFVLSRKLLKDSGNDEVIL